MPSDIRRPASPAPLPLSRKVRLTMDEAIAAMKHHNDKVRADELQVDNAETSPLLKLPQELLEKIYEHVYDGQTIQMYLSPNGKARMFHNTDRQLFALPSTCRKLHQDTSDYPYTKTTFMITTFKFVSMFDTWRTAIRRNPNVLLDFLESVPAPWIEHIEVVDVGTRDNSYGAYGACKMDLSLVQGYEDSIDHKAEMEEIIRMVYPEAIITFRTVVSVRQI